MDTILKRAEQRRRTALRILDDLALIDRWSLYGRPVLVGAVAYDLVVSPDIDMEIYCPTLRIEHGFEILRTCAQFPNVIKAQFSNHLNDRDKALYWKLHYRHTDGVVWTIDMWSAPEDYALPRAENLVAPLRKSLTYVTRQVILRLKELRQLNPALECPSIDLYRAVIDDGVRTEADLYRWLKKNPTGSLTPWVPGG